MLWNTIFQNAQDIMQIRPFYTGLVWNAPTCMSSSMPVQHMGVALILQPETKVLFTSPAVSNMDKFIIVFTSILVLYFISGK